MSETSKNWPALYRVAVLESERGRLPARIDEASAAIRCRARELWYAGSLETREQRDLDAALHFLELLQMVGVDNRYDSHQPREHVRDSPIEHSCFASPKSSFRQSRRAPLEASSVPSPNTSLSDRANNILLSQGTHTVSKNEKGEHRESHT
jgi:hypothetical protein